MSEPRRLFEESSDELELALLRAGSNISASAEMREKTLAALGIGGAMIASGAAVATGAALAASGGKGVSGVLSLLSFKTAALVVSVAVGVGAPVYYFSEEAPAPVARLPKPARFVEARAGKAPVSKPSGLVAEAPPAPRVIASAAPTAAPAKLPPAEALRAELVQLDAARARLSSGRPEEALRLLDGYARSTPHGRLRLEAEVLRIDALSKSGRSAQAKRRAQSFLERYPKSVLAARVRRIAGE